MLKSLCELFHGAEEKAAHGAIILLNDAGLQRVCAAFSLMPPPRFIVERVEIQRDLFERPTEEFNMGAIWAAMWQATVVDWEMLSVRSGIFHMPTLTRCFDQLVGARLVYPDGSISETATDILNAMTVREIEQATGRRQSGGGEA